MKNGFLRWTQDEGTHRSQSLDVFPLALTTYSFYDPVSGTDHVKLFQCFVPKGSTIKEQKPLRLDYFQHFLVSEGKIGEIKSTIKVCRYAFPDIP